MMPVSVAIRRGSARFVDRAPGRVAHHSLSFGEHHDPEWLRLGPMVCHDDHLVAPGQGFGPHRHTDLEIVTWVMRGALSHVDSVSGEGRESVVRPGTVQLLSAGSGVEHSEVGLAGAGPTRFLQVWLTPDRAGSPPAYTTAAVDVVPGALTLVASDHGDAPVRVGAAGATFWVARLGGGQSVRLPDAPLLHVFVGRGALTRSSLAQPLADGDAFLVREDPGLEVTAAVATELLIWGFD